MLSIQNIHRRHFLKEKITRLERYENILELDS